MTPNDFDALVAKNDGLLRAIDQMLDRIEAKHAGERQDLLQVVAGLIESDPAFRYAIAMLLD